MTDTADSAELVDDNRRHWDERVPIHAASSFYDLDVFRAGDDGLDRFQLDEVGDVDGLDLVHLQCHIGLDTLSWARHGARVSGVDFSAAAIDAASGLAEEIGIAHKTRFVTADVYDAAKAELLRPGGRLYLVEFHPITDTLDDATGAAVVEDYFARGPRTYHSPGTYADWETTTTHNSATEWHHTVGDVVSTIAAAGLRIEFLHEHDTIPFQRYRALVTDGSNFRYPDRTPRMPLMYSLAATTRMKPATGPADAEDSSKIRLRTRQSAVEREA
ncbi:bifunctional 2-polyprenyl-6-hydroxyphenol methylase/3-demethylubiquinol 3-O-methyltransferase UbiG [Nocardia sp. CNY236]|uniref:class I SAM-dependent methyltransferase n=1 Tax=Nocardia sp. CNY236 TaxID=1169152 RepID=UPI0003F9A738|nr:class I SAM-dependent methyltransferase [Nocardia sp. CNY236]